LTASVSCAFNHEFFDEKNAKQRRINIHLTGWLVRGSLRGLFHLRYVQNLQCYGIESHARQCHPPARLGQKEGWCGPTHHEKCAAHFRAEPAAPAHLGTGAKEVCAHSRYGAWSKDNQQTRCL
jgi:hypothetical protein